MSQPQLNNNIYNLTTLLFKFRDHMFLFLGVTSQCNLILTPCPMVAPTTLQISLFFYTNFVADSFTLVLYFLYYYNNIPPVETGIERKKNVPMCKKN